MQLWWSKFKKLEVKRSSSLACMFQGSNSIN